MGPLPRDVKLVLLVGVLAAVLIAGLLLRSRSSATALTFSECDRLVEALHNRVAAIPQQTDPDLIRAVDSVQLQAAYLEVRLHRFGEQAYFPEDPAWARIPIVERDVDAVLKGTNPFKHRKGSLILGYRSALDGSLQPYALAVPPAYSPAKPMPLIVSLHGFSWPEPMQEPPAGFNPEAIVLEPHGRDSTDFMYTGEVDVFDAMTQVRMDYAIDPDRIYLVGRSMGGTGCWWLGTRHPDFFAGIAPAQGNTSHRLWQASSPPPGIESPVGTVVNLLRDALDPASYAENLLHVPSFNMHGSADEVNSVLQSRVMEQRLAELRYTNFLYWEFPGFTHYPMPMFASDVLVELLLKQKRVGAPKWVRYKTDSLRYRRAYWLEIERLERLNAFAQVDARVKDGPEVGSPAVFEARTHNIGGFAVSTAVCPLPPGKLEAQIDDSKLELPAQRPPRLHFVRANGTWSLRPDAGPAGKAALPGPIDDVFLTPFMIVFGTRAATEQLNNVIRAEAEQLAISWLLRYGNQVRLKPDMDVTDDDRRRYSLVLYGGPDENYVTLKLSDKLPIQIAGGAIRVGDQVFRGEDVGVKFCCPSPDNPARYVAVFAGIGQKGIFQINNRFGNESGWFVYANRNWFDYAVFDSGTSGQHSFLCVGFFNQDWKLDASLQWRRASRPQGAPSFVPTQDATGQYLSSMWPAGIAQLRGPVTFDTDLSGAKLKLGEQEFERGLGVCGPSDVLFAVPAGASRLQATVGLDPGQLQGVPAAELEDWALAFEVLDGSTSPKSLFRSGKVTGASKPVKIDVPVAGVKLVKLRAQLAGRYKWILPRGVWADAKFAR